MRLDGPGIALVRLSAGGMLRWYAACCRAPLANTFAHPRLPFVGLVAARVVDRAALDAAYGPAVGVQGRFAPNGCPPGVLPSASLAVIAGSVSLLARGALRGAHAPSPVWRDGALVATPRVLTPAERAALSPPSGPS